MGTMPDEGEIPRRTTGAVAPMSFAQELLWMLDRATPGLTAYNVPRVFRIRGALDTDALRRALGHVVERHEVLRTTYGTTDAGPVQTVHAPTAFVLPIVDLRGVPAEDRERELGRQVDAESRRTFDLGNELLLRGTLWHLADDDHALLAASHHIANDGWSKGLLYRELSAAYEAYAAGREPALPALPIQYADFATWQREALGDGHALEEHLAYWRGRLASPPSMELPTDFPRPASQSFDGARKTLIVPKAQVEALRDLGMEHGATPYMTLLALYQTLLHRYTGQDDIITGSPIAGRTRTETESVIGYFANILAMRTSFAGDPTFGELLERISENAIDAYEHEDVPFEKLVLDLRAGQEAPSHAPLFRCVLTMEDTIEATIALGTAQVEPIAIDFGMAKFDLTLLVSEVPEGLRFSLWYRTDLFTDGYADRFLGHFRTLIDSVLADAETPVSRLPMLTADERAQLAAWNATNLQWTPAFAGVTPNSQTLVELFEVQAARVPGRSAVVAPRASASAAGSVAGTQVLTYQELNARANQLARHLRANGVERDTPVGLLLDRSADAIVGLLGILKSGGAYVPLALEAPAARLATQIGEAGIRVVVTNGSAAEKLPGAVQVVALDRDAGALGALADDNVDAVATPESLAYVLYTSGSTGVPKGVAVTHANVVHYARAVSRVLAGDLAQLDGAQFGLASTLAADLGNTSLYPSLLAGGTLHVLSKDVTTDPARFAEYASVHQLDVLKITPNHFAALAAGKTGSELAAIMPRRWLVTGGEALRPALAKALLAAGKCRVLNHYGPTETTVGVCTFEATDSALHEVAAVGAQTVPIGYPLANTHAYVVASTAAASLRSEEQPVGIPGELLLGGAGVTNGYLKRDDLTAERFVSFNGERVYRTGDRVRRLPNGAIEFLGRADDQVKVRGYRVELGEIEQILRAHPGVANGAVIVRTPDSGDPQLVAYSVAKQAGYAVSHSDRPTAERLREWLAAQLPEHMVPTAVVLMDALPLTPNGKLDKHALPAPDATATAVDDHVAPRTPTEETVARIWRDVLKKERIGVTESFLDLGGHSLLAIRVLGRINKELGVRLALRALFETPTVEKIAAIIDGELAERQAEAALRDALAAIEGLSDDEVARQLAGDGPAEVK